MRIAVIGAGAWGTALAITLAKAHAIRLWVREGDLAARMRLTRENDLFLPGYRLPDSIVIHDRIGDAAADPDLVLVVTPTMGLRQAVEALASARVGAPVVWACKGLEPGSAKLPHEVVEDLLGAGYPSGVLSGPSFAVEVARGLPAAVTLACRDLELARRLVVGLNSPHFRLYASDDVIGVEVGGAVKNVLAIAAGVSDGMHFGLNARAALITRGLAEIARLGKALGARRETFMGLAGIGDLILTCTGDLSRNRRVGLALAAGESLEAFQRELGPVAEGVHTALEVNTMANRLGVDMPITQAIKGVLFDGVPARDAVERLLAREPKIEG
jgi:glycerol-3-phosphate dehydrogenase (NAD(P)+)